MKRYHLRSPSSCSSHSSNMYSGSVTTTNNDTKFNIRDNLSTMTVTGANSI